MNLQTRTEDYDEPFVSENFVKSVVIGAIVGGVSFLLYRKLSKKKRSHIIPPIIIKSLQETGEPIEIESRDPLSEHEALQSQSNLVDPKVYRLSNFGLTTFLRVYRQFTKPAVITPYENVSGLTVNMWLQYKDGGDWLDLDGGPHLVVDGTLPGAPLTCEKLSGDKPNPGNNERPRKRSFNKHKKWRIWRVEVDDDPIELEDFKKMEIRFYDQDPDHDH
jgi:hypothetical protein